MWDEWTLSLMSHRSACGTTTISLLIIRQSWTDSSSLGRTVSLRYRRYAGASFLSVDNPRSVNDEFKDLQHLVSRLISCKSQIYDWKKAGYDTWFKLKQNWMQDWQYGKGFINLFEANISANIISLPQGQSYTKGEYYNGSSDLNLNLRKRLMIK